MFLINIKKYSKIEQYSIFFRLHIRNNEKNLNNKLFLYKKYLPKYIYTNIISFFLIVGYNKY